MPGLVGSLFLSLCPCIGGMCGGGSEGDADRKKARRKSDGVLKKQVKEGGMAHSQFIMSNPGKIHEYYELERKKLGEGSYGSVVRAKHKPTGALRAIKTISKVQMKDADLFKQEIDIMKMMDHPNIVKLYETFEDHRNIYLVMELCKGGELFDRIIDAGHFTESQAAILMQQIIRAIYFMHERKICHRDLKPENFLFMTKDRIESSILKIIDFGLSCPFEDGQVLTTKAGTPYYVAPQVLMGKYDQLSDMWSCGVIMYVMLCGYPPFFGETDADVLAKVKLGSYTFSKADWRNISEDAKNLIRQLLKMNPHERYTAERALNHEWIKNKAPKATNVSLQENFVENLRGFRSQNKLKKAALHIIASQLSEDKIKALRETFMALDANGDGLLTSVEMREGIEKAGLKDIPQDLQQILEDVDQDGSGVIDYTEFLAATLDKRLYMQEDVCWSAFRLLDRNGDGKISSDELRCVLEQDDAVAEAMGCADAKAQAVKALISEVDTSGDGMIDFEEFMTMMRGKR